jgi:hypothetical protein
LLVRNGFLILAALATTLPRIPRALHWIDATSLVGGALALGLLFQAVNTLMALRWLGPDRENAS